MAQADIIRELLVKLGYKVDEASQRRFAEGVERMTERVKDLAKGAVVMGTAVGVAVVKVVAVVVVVVVAMVVDVARSRAAGRGG